MTDDLADRVRQQGEAIATLQQQLELLEITRVRHQLDEIAHGMAQEILADPKFQQALRDIVRKFCRKTTG